MTEEFNELDRGSSLQAKMFYLFGLTRAARMRGRRGHHGRAVFHGQGRALHLLSMQSPIAQKELAYLLGIRPQSLGELLTKMEAGELIVRGPNPQDRRTSIIELTEKGRKMAEEHKEFIGQDPFEVLDEQERETFSAMLDKVITAMEDKFPEGVDRRGVLKRGGKRHGKCGCSCGHTPTP